MNDKELFSQLFRKQYPQLFRLASLMLKDDEEARDVVTDTFARLWSGEIRSVDAGMDKWLACCVRNRCIDLLRRQSITEKVMRRLPMEMADNAFDSAWERRVNAVGEYVHTELTPQMQRVLTMRFFEKKTYREIAASLAISEVAVYKHLANALARLRKKFDNQETTGGNEDGEV